MLINVCFQILLCLLGGLPNTYNFSYFDEGATAKEMNVESANSPPNTFVNGGWNPNPYLLSMYFEYVSAQNYVKNLTDPTGNQDNLVRIQSLQRYNYGSESTDIRAPEQNQGIHKAIS